MGAGLVFSDGLGCSLYIAAGQWSEQKLVCGQPCCQSNCWPILSDHLPSLHHNTAQTLTSVSTFKGKLQIRTVTKVDFFPIITTDNVRYVPFCSTWNNLSCGYFTSWVSYWEKDTIRMGANDVNTFLHWWCLSRCVAHCRRLDCADNRLDLWSVEADEWVSKIMSDLVQMRRLDGGLRMTPLHDRALICICEQHGALCLKTVIHGSVPEAVQGGFFF